MAELKDRQQQEREGELQFHFCLMLTECISESLQLEGVYVENLLSFKKGVPLRRDQWLHRPAGGGRAARRRGKPVPSEGTAGREGMRHFLLEARRGTVGEPALVSRAQRGGWNSMKNPGLRSKSL